MSKYTTEVRYICEREAGLNESVGLDDIEKVLDNSWYAIFLEGFPVFDESHRADLCKSILRHYYSREICCETVGIWKLWLRQRMIEIMPKYNVMYEANAKKFNFLDDVDVYTDRDRGTSGTSGQSVSGNAGTEISSESTDNGSSERWDKYSDTPQGALDNVKNGTYLTNARNVTDESTDKNVSKGTSKSTNVSDTNGRYEDKENETVHEHGKRGGMTYTAMMKEYRDSAISIDQMIIEELSDLFMQIW